MEDFSGPPGQDGLPEGWRTLEFPKIERHTVYTIESDGTNSFLKAESRNSASGLYKEVDVELREFPILSWRWKVERIIEKGDARTKQGDDYAARLYVTFEYDPERTPFFERVKYKVAELIYGKVPASAINYIWANRLGKGGPEFVGRWVSEERNVYEDYKAFFGEEPPRVAGIAVMTDTDDTKESAVAYYDDIVLNG
jgi:hypothetical protein